MRRLPLTLTALACSLALPAAATAADQTMLGLDASGSMWDKVDGRTKVEIAREPSPACWARGLRTKRLASSSTGIGGAAIAQTSRR